MSKHSSSSVLVTCVSKSERFLVVECPTCSCRFISQCFKVLLVLISKARPKKLFSDKLRRLKSRFLTYRLFLEVHSFGLNKSFERYISEWKLRLGTFEPEKGTASIRYFLLPPRNQEVNCIEFIIKNLVLELSVKIRDKFLDIYKSTFKIKRTWVVDSACDYSLQTWLSKRGTVTSGNIKVQWSGSTQALTDCAVRKKIFPCECVRTWSNPSW